MDKNVERQLSACVSIYQQYAWLLNCYVLDFFTESHWKKLLQCWQSLLRSLTPGDIANLLNYNSTLKERIWPLSLLSLKKLCNFLSFSRTQHDLKLENPRFFTDDKVLNLFWKNVKNKKRHEILIMSKICYESALETNCFYIVDIGAGLGHLSRMLNYGYGFKVCTIEAQESLSKQATLLDTEFEKSLQRKFSGCFKQKTTVHVNKRISSEISVSNFLTVVKRAFKIEENNFRFGLVGLHPCGDLGATLLKLYTECSHIQYINIVGCCYMKLSKSGFPLSQFGISNNYNLSYHSREIACHAIENYIEKLLNGEQWRLKIHTFRALLEKIIVNNYPHYHHCALNNVKYNMDLSFEHYCKKAVKKLKIDIPNNVIATAENEKLLLHWKEVVVFYSLRLLFAPIIETIIMLDRFLYLLENGSFCCIKSAFDPKISPRCHVLTAKKQI